MKELFYQYIISLFQGVPVWVYEGLLSVFCVGAVLIVAIKGLRKGWRYASALLLIEYVFLLYGSTVIFRTASEIVGYNFHPFWSYAAIQQGRAFLIPENIMNVIVFMPVGALLGFVFRSIKWWQVLLIGCGISVSIEALQFFTHRGFSEFDDVFHNTLGCVIGFLCNLRYYWSNDK